MTLNKNDFEISLNHSRGLGGSEDVTSAADFDVWHAISEAYSNVSFTAKDNEMVYIRIDWSSALEYAAKLKQLYSKPPDEVMKTLSDNYQFFDHAIVCPAEVTFDPSPKITKPWQGSNYLHHLLYEIFLIANLSVPGCFNLYRSHIRAKELDPIHDPLAQTDLQLSEFMFENAWHVAQEKPWLKIDFIPFSKVLSWYRLLALGHRQVAKSNIEKALFALLHMSRSSFLEPEATFWIASALEATFDTPPGSAFQFLHKRIGKILALNEKQHASMRKHLREFYDVRNRFSHGGGAICHPIAHEGWDPDVEKVFRQTINANIYAAALLLASIQEIIRRNIAGIKFDEAISDVPFEKTV